mmetsp:Transcript_45833/g.97912  ORF Transcript_45833/g.97912 Transcript_45833/m.97912 type:complete len:218 (+) Transcript_45833:403-1056(+)
MAIATLAVLLVLPVLVAAAAASPWASLLLAGVRSPLLHLLQPLLEFLCLLQIAADLLAQGRDPSVVLAELGDHLQQHLQALAVHLVGLVETAGAFQRLALGDETLAFLDTVLEAVAATASASCRRSSIGLPLFAARIRSIVLVLLPRRRFARFRLQRLIQLFRLVKVAVDTLTQLLGLRVFLIDLRHDFEEILDPRAVLLVRLLGITFRSVSLAVPH